MEGLDLHITFNKISILLLDIKRNSKHCNILSIQHSQTCSSSPFTRDMPPKRKRPTLLDDPDVVILECPLESIEDENQSDSPSSTAIPTVGLYIGCADKVIYLLIQLDASSLDHWDEVMDIFGLHEGDIETFNTIQGEPIPQHLAENLERICAVTASNKNQKNKLFAWMVIDQLLISAVYEENKPDTVKEEENEPYQTRFFVCHDSKLSTEVIHEDRKITLTASADHSIWTRQWGCVDEAELLIVEERCCSDLHRVNAKAQLVACLAIARTRLQERYGDGSVNGILSDGRYFRFCSVNASRELQWSREFDWKHRGDPEKVFAIIRSLIRSSVHPLLRGGQIVLELFDRSDKDRIREG